MRTDVRRDAAATGRDQFPVGMWVLAVDDDPACLKVLETLLRRCQYHVTATNQAVIALRMLRENRAVMYTCETWMALSFLELVGLEWTSLSSVHNDDEVRALFKQVQGEVPGSPIFIMKVASQS